MEQVVLHLADDAPEDPQVAAQHRCLVHEPHRVGESIVLHHDVSKSLAVGRIAAKSGAHQAPRVVQRTQRAARKPLDAQGCLVQPEGLQYGVRFALVQVVGRNVEHPGLVVEAQVDRPRRLCRRVQPLFQIEQQYLVELRDCLGRPVVAAHQRLAGAHHRRFPARCAWRRRVGAGGGRQRGHVSAERGALVPEGLGDRRLQVEHQAVFAPARQQVQPHAYQAQQRLVALDLPDFKGRRQPGARERVPAVAQACRFGDPQDHLQVAQTPGRLFAIGLQCVRRVLEFAVALAQLQRLGDKKCTSVQGLSELHAKVVEQRRVARHQARLEHRGLHGDIPGRLFQALRHGTHARADFQPQVPAGADERLYARLQCGIALGRLCICKQQQDIDIRTGKQLGTAVAADRRQRAGRPQTAHPP